MDIDVLLADIAEYFENAMITVPDSILSDDLAHAWYEYGYRNAVADVIAYLQDNFGGDDG